MPNVRLFLRLLVDPGWAPAGVAVLFLALVAMGHAGRFDHVTHSLGGAAMAFFFFRAVWLVRGSARYALAFTSAVTVAVLWELAEYAADRWAGTSLLGSAEETVLDLGFGTLGALAALGVVALVGLVARGRQ